MEWDVDNITPINQEWDTDTEVCLVALKEVKETEKQLNKDTSWDIDVETCIYDEQDLEHMYSQALLNVHYIIGYDWINGLKPYTPRAKRAAQAKLGTFEQWSRQYR